MQKIHQQAIACIDAGGWDAAHRLVQDYSDPLSCRIHAHLHRIEGDLSNARYWYGRAGAAMPTQSFAEECEELRLSAEQSPF